MDNLYKILEIPDYSDSDTIKKAYRKLINQYHPDNFSNASEEEKQKSEETTRKINIAYDTLSNEEKKRNYDAKLKYDSDHKKYTQSYGFSSEYSSNHESSEDYEYEEFFNKKAKKTHFNQYEQDIRNTFFKMEKEDKINHEIWQLNWQKNQAEESLEKRKRKIELDSLSSNEYQMSKENADKINLEIMNVIKEKRQINNELTRIYNQLLKRKNHILNRIFPGLFFKNSISKLQNNYHDLEQQISTIQQQLDNKRIEHNNIKVQMQNFPPEEYYVQDEEVRRLILLITDLDAKIEKYKEQLAKDRKDYTSRSR